jgi:hypothetical protein
MRTVALSYREDYLISQALFYAMKYILTFPKFYRERSKMRDMFFLFNKKFQTSTIGTPEGWEEIRRELQS